MSPFDLQDSMEQARRRVGGPPSRPTRARRSDRGVSRLQPDVLDCVARALGGQERPRMREILGDLRRCCREQGHEPPSRATVYKLMATLGGGTVHKSDLPPSVQSALYNLVPESKVPAHQVAFYCFNYGNLEAVSFAAGLPWLALYQALRLPGYRKKSRGLVEAVAAARGI